jgi:hypothetical protein
MKIRRSIQLSSLTLTAVMLCGCPSDQPSNQPNIISLTQLQPGGWEVLFTNTSGVNITGFSTPSINTTGVFESEITPTPVTPHCTSSITLAPNASCYYGFFGNYVKAVGTTNSGTITLSANLASGGPLTVTLPTTLTSVLYAGNSNGNISMWNGSSWSSVGTSGLTNLTALVVDTPYNGQFVAGTSTGCSAWNGKAWHTISSCPNNITAFAINPKDASIAIYGATSANTNAVQKYTFDIGFTTVGTSTNNVKALITDANGDNFYAATANGIQTLAYNGSTWSNVGTNSPAGALSLAIDGTRYLYAVTSDGAIAYANLADDPNWVTEAIPAPGEEATILAYDAATNTLYGGTNNKIFYLDSGKNRVPLTNGPTGVNALIADPVNGDLYAGNSTSIQKYNGSTWTNITSANTPTNVNTLAIGQVLDIQAP